jgi:hypothetical protein
LFIQTTIKEPPLHINQYLLLNKTLFEFQIKSLRSHFNASQPSKPYLLLPTTDSEPKAGSSNLVTGGFILQLFFLLLFFLYRGAKARKRRRGCDKKKEEQERPIFGNYSKFFVMAIIWIKLNYK